MANYTTITSDKDKKLAFWLCLFGGFFGVHQFYVGNIGKGILYLFTCGLFMIGWIGDLIAISTGSFKDNSGQPLRASKEQMNQQSNNTTIVNNVSSADELSKYKKLLDEGAITQEEFDNMKSKILK